MAGGWSHVWGAGEDGDGGKIQLRSRELLWSVGWAQPGPDLTTQKETRSSAWGECSWALTGPHTASWPLIRPCGDGSVRPWSNYMAIDWVWPGLIWPCGNSSALIHPLSNIPGSIQPLVLRNLAAGSVGSDNYHCSPRCLGSTGQTGPGAEGWAPLAIDWFIDSHWVEHKMLKGKDELVLKTQTWGSRINLVTWYPFTASTFLKNWNINAQPSLQELFSR